MTWPESQYYNRELSWVTERVCASMTRARDQSRAADRQQQHHCEVTYLTHLSLAIPQLVCFLTSSDVQRHQQSPGVDFLLFNHFLSKSNSEGFYIKQGWSLIAIPRTWVPPAHFPSSTVSSSHVCMLACVCVHICMQICVPTCSQRVEEENIECLFLSTPPLRQVSQILELPVSSYVGPQRSSQLCLPQC